MRITARRAKKLRQRIERIGPCPERPGFLHDFHPVEVPDPSSLGGTITVMECSKCEAWGW